MGAKHGPLQQDGAMEASSFFAGAILRLVEGLAAPLASNTFAT